MTTTVKPIDDRYHDLLTNPIIMALATTLSDGTPQVTPVWFSYEDGYICFNTAAGRVKDKAIKARPYVAVTIVDPTNDYRYLAIRGPVEVIDDPAVGRQHINELNAKYCGNPVYPGPIEEQRVKFRMAPEHVFAAG